MDDDELRALKKEIFDNCHSDIRDLGYNLMGGIGKDSLEMRLQPLPGSPDPIQDDVWNKIKQEILGENYKGAKVNLRYVGAVRSSD